MASAIPDRAALVQSGFIFQKLPQLRESPQVQNGSLLASGRDPFADATQVFDGDAAPRAISFGNDQLTDIVIESLSCPASSRKRRLAARVCVFCSFRRTRRCR